MNKGFQIFLIWKYIIFVSIAFTLSGCPLTVNLNISTDKPFEMKLGADVAVTKVPPIKVGISKTENNNNAR